MAGAGLGEVDEHPDDGDRGEERDRGGPAREEAERDARVRARGGSRAARDVHGVAERELGDDDLLRQLIGDQRGNGDGQRARASGTAAPRATARPSRSARGRPWPTRRERRSAAGRVWLTPLFEALAVDAPVRVRHRLEPLLGDRLAAASRRSRTSPPRSAATPRRSPRGHAPSSPRACSRSRGSASPSPSRRGGCRTSPPRSRPRSSRNSPRGGGAQSRVDARRLLLLQQDVPVAIRIHGDRAAPGDTAQPHRAGDTVEYNPRPVVPERSGGLIRGLRAPRCRLRGGRAR